MKAVGDRIWVKRRRARLNALYQNSGKRKTLTKLVNNYNKPITDDVRAENLFKLMLFLSSNRIPLDCLPLIIEYEASGVIDYTLLSNPLLVVNSRKRKAYNGSSIDSERLFEMHKEQKKDNKDAVFNFDPAAKPIGVMYTSIEISIPKITSKSELLDSIDYLWPTIKRELETIEGSLADIIGRRAKRNNYIGRDILVTQLLKSHSSAEVSKILQDEYGIKLSPAYVRKIKSRSIKT